MLDSSSEALDTCCRRLGLQLRIFSQTSDFLAESLIQIPDCLIIDLDRVVAATSLLSELGKRGYSGVIIAAASELDVATAVEVMERGCLTILKKPLETARLELYLKQAVELVQQHKELQARYLSFLEKQSGLTSRQCEILWGVLNGQPTKAIALKLDISNRLVELERSRLLKTFDAESTTELALRVGEFLALQRTLAPQHGPHFARLRASAERWQYRSPA